MGRLRAATLLLAALAAGLLLAACGSGDKSELLPGTTASQIESNLDQVRSNVKEGNCEAAEDAVAQVTTEIEELQKVDKELKAALKQGAAKLSEVVGSCGVKEEEAEQAKAEKEAEAEEQANLEAEEEVAAEEETEQKEEDREAKAKEKAEKHAEQPGPSEEDEETGPKGEAKGHEEEEIEPPAEEVIPPAEGGPAGGIGPGAEVEGTP
jgi:myosin heavy subunit